MKIYGKSCRSALKTKQDEQPLYDPSTKEEETFRHCAKHSQRSNPNYRFEYIDRVHESLKDPNSKYHGTRKRLAAFLVSSGFFIKRWQIYIYM